MAYNNQYSQHGLYPPAPGPYQNLYSQSTDSILTVPDEKYAPASAFEEPSRGWGKKKWAILGASILLVCAVAGGVAGGIIASKSSSSNTAAKDTKTSETASNGPAAGSDSNFAKDSRLHQSFSGMCYSPPYSSFYPNCGDTIDGVVKDIQLMSQLTGTIRLYGSDCNTSSLVLDAINRTGVNMTVFLAIYFDPDPDVFPRQLEEVTKALQSFGPDHVDGIIVGNEYILNAFNGANSASAATRAQAAAQRVVIANIATTRAAITALNLSKTLPIGTADAGSMITEALAEASDFIMANVHPFFAGVNIEDAAGWTWEYLETDTPSVALRASNRPTLYASEIGWPSDAAQNGSLTLNGSSASIEHLQLLLDTYVCTSNTNQTKSFWFEAFDERWKMAAFGGAEPFWGLFDSNRNLKPVTIPDCPVDYSMAV